MNLKIEVGILCTMRAMIPYRGLSATERLVLLATAAVLLPTMVLVALQYRQSRELQNKTQVAVKEDLRETLADISTRTEAEMVRLSGEAFRPISIATVSPADSSKLKEHFEDFARSHPEVAELWVVPTCASAGNQPAAHFFSGGQWREVPQADQSARQIQTVFNMARRAVEADREHARLIFWQQSCNCEKRPPIYVFRSVPDGILGMTLDFDYVQQHYLSRLLADTVASKSIASNGYLSAWRG